MSQRIQFDFQGKQHSYVSRIVDTDYGPEVAVTIYDDKNEVVGASQECMSAARQVSEWKDAVLEEAKLFCPDCGEKVMRVIEETQPDAGGESKQVCTCDNCNVIVHVFPSTQRRTEMSQKPKITAFKFPGHADGEWEVRIDGRTFVNGLFRREVPYYKKVALEHATKNKKGAK